MTARGLHRLIAPVAGVCLLYIGVTGVILQGVDLTALLRRAPAADADMQAIRESLDGPSSFSVIAAPDYDAPALPAAALSGRRLADAAARAGAPARYAELRMAGGRPVVQIMTDRLLRFDAATLAPLPVPAEAPRGPQASAHRLAKQWHRTWALGDGMLWLNALIGAGLGVMTVAGLIMYAQLLRARLRLGRKAPFWSFGGLWRTWHRGVALAAALPLLVVAVSGTLLSIDSFALQVFKWTHPKEVLHGVMPVGMIGDLSRPMTARELPDMLNVTLAAYRRREGGRPVKAVRVRYFANIPQGVVIAGGAETRQFVFNARTGARMTSSEPGYPYMGFPFGWREHELMKRIHRGDILGLPGRGLDLLAGLSLIWLSASGLWMYIDLKRRRRKSRPVRAPIPKENKP